MKKIMVDERTREQEWKIREEVLGIIISILGLSSFVKFFFLRMGGESIVVELSCLFLGGAYYVIRSYAAGHAFFSGENSLLKIFLKAVASGLLLVVLAGGVKYFFGAFILIFSVEGILYGLNKHKQRQIEKELDEEEA